MTKLGHSTKAVLMGAIIWFAVVSEAHAEPLVIGYSAVSSVFLPFWIGKEVGFYKKDGLDAQLVYIASSTSMAQAMFARQVAISSVNSGEHHLHAFALHQGNFLRSRSSEKSSSQGIQRRAFLR
jgi:ABC-type nitrate/sulfonate/bicarbonate transport system substrate-binding protein